MSTSPQSTQSLILEKAKERLIEDGLAHFSMRKVAEACGVSAPALYRHYKDKDALLATVLEEGAQRFTAYLVDALSEKTPKARLMKMGERYFAFARAHPRDYELLFLTDCAALGLDALASRAQEEARSAFQLLVDRVSECQREGVMVLGNPAELAVFIWSSLHGICALELRGGMGGGSEEHLEKQQVDFVWRALALSPG